MSKRLRIVLPSVMGIVSLPLVLWDIHNARVIESMGMAWDMGAPIWPYQASDILLRLLNGPAYSIAMPIANLLRLAAPAHLALVVRSQFLVRGGGIVGFSALHGFGALYFAFVFLTVVATYVEPLAVHSVLHGLPYPEFPRLEATAVVNLVDQVGAFQLVDLRATVRGCYGQIATTAGGVGVDPDIPTLDRSLLIGRRRLVGGRNRGGQQNEK